MLPLSAASSMAPSHGDPEPGACIEAAAASSSIMEPVDTRTADAAGRERRWTRGWGVGCTESVEVMEELREERASLSAKGLLASGLLVRDEVDGGAAGVFSSARARLLSRDCSLWLKTLPQSATAEVNGAWPSTSECAAGSAGGTPSVR